MEFQICVIALVLTHAIMNLRRDIAMVSTCTLDGVIGLILCRADLLSGYVFGICAIYGLRH